MNIEKIVSISQALRQKMIEIVNPIVKLDAKIQNLTNYPSQTIIVIVDNITKLDKKIDHLYECLFHIVKC